MLERPDPLQAQFGEIRIPPGIPRDLRVDEELPGSLLIRAALDSGGLVSVPLPDDDIVRGLNGDLDQGESEAIALARQIDLVLLDESEGRETAKKLNLTPLGTRGVLLKAKQLGTVTSLQDELTALRTKAGFYLAPDLRARILSLGGEG